MKFAFVATALMICFGGCSKSAPPMAPPKQVNVSPPKKQGDSPGLASGTAKSEDVKAVQARLKTLGDVAKVKAQGDLLTEIVIDDGSEITADDLALFGKLLDLRKLQIFNCRSLNDEMVVQLGGLQELTSLALTNSVINDATVEFIAKSFPKLTELDLSSNTNISSGVMKVIAEITGLERLTLVQCRFNEISTKRLSRMPNLRAIDLRGNMEAGDMTLEVVGQLPKLVAFKHRSTAVTDRGMEHLAKCQSLESLLVQDFAITNQSGPHLSQLKKLKQAEIFRCQGFGSEGALSLKGLPLERLTLRDLPAIDDLGLELLNALPSLKRLYLHELEGVSDEGLKHLAGATSLELLDIWSVPQLTDRTMAIIVALPNLKELSLRMTGISDHSLELLMQSPKLQSLTLKDNGGVSEASLEKLSARKWTKLDR
jgi:hypothetical protein